MDALDNMIIATHDKTLAPASQLEEVGNGDIGFSQPAFRENEIRKKYTLKEDHTPQSIVPGMLEIPPPDSTVLGGMNQTQKDAPIQFYRFTSARMQKMKEDMY